MEFDTLVYYGGAVKALGDGRVGGRLIHFSGPTDPDLTGEFFTKSTDFKMGRLGDPMFLYDHAMDDHLGDREIGSAKMGMDDAGIWVEGQLAMRDEYEKKIYQMAQDGKLGWSSGSAGHLVRKRMAGKASEILSWPIVEASLTPIPAEVRCYAMPMKSLYQGGPAPGLPAFEVRTQELVAGLKWFRDTFRKFSDQRVKAGRVLSTANRERIRKVVESVKPMVDDLEQLLAETDQLQQESESGSDTLPMGEQPGTQVIQPLEKLKRFRLAWLGSQQFLRETESGYRTSGVH